MVMLAVTALFGPAAALLLPVHPVEMRRSRLPRMVSQVAPSEDIWNDDVRAAWASAYQTYQGERRFRLLGKWLKGG